MGDMMKKELGGESKKKNNPGDEYPLFHKVACKQEVTFFAGSLLVHLDPLGSGGAVCGLPFALNLFHHDCVLSIG